MYNELHILLSSIKNEATVRQKNNVQVQHKKDTNMSNNIIQLHIITYISMICTERRIQYSIYQIILYMQLHIITYISMILKGEYSIQYIK